MALVTATNTTDNNNEHNDDATYAEVSRLHCDGVEASLQCLQQRGCNAGDESSMTKAKMPIQRWQWRRRNASEDNSAILVIPPARCRQGCQRNADKDTSAALTGTLETKLAGNNA
jgi:hypothetical protein